MANSITIPIPSVHWFTYPIAVGGLLVVLWLWHDTKVKDAATIQAVKVAQTSQANTDTKVTLADKTAQKDLQNKNAALDKKLSEAKTAQQQIALINEASGTHIEQPQAIIPSSTIPEKSVCLLPLEDLPTLAKQATEVQELQNQVATDQVSLAGKTQQIEVRDETIKAQYQEIQAARGGSRIKRFFKEAKVFVVGAGVGAAVVYATKH